jgi:multicomponent Na+:H+ antiporter subunit E
MKNGSIVKLAIHFCLMMAFWLVMSGYFDLFHISLGVASVCTVLLFNSRLWKYPIFPETEERPHRFSFIRLCFYFLYLFKEIVVSALKVAVLVIHPRMPVKTGVIRFRTNLPSMNARVLLGNSITLTPGTVTMSIDGDEFLVHSLTAKGTPSHMDYGLALAVAKVFGVDPARVVSNEVIIDSEEKL